MLEKQGKRSGVKAGQWQRALLGGGGGMWQRGACRWPTGVCNRQRLQGPGEEVCHKGQASGGSGNWEQGSGKVMKASRNAEVGGLQRELRLGLGEVVQVVLRMERKCRT